MKMKTLQFLVLALAFVGLLVGCQHKNRKYLDKVNVLEQKLDSIENDYESLDIEKIESIYAIVQKRTDHLYANYKLIVDQDSTAKEYIQAYRNLNKRLNRTFKRGGKSLGDDIKVRSKQISDLKHDIKQEIFTDTVEVNKYIDIETKAVADLLLKGKILMDQLETEREHYYVLKDSIDVIMERNGLRKY